MSNPITLHDIVKAPLDAIASAMQEHDQERIDNFRANLTSLDSVQTLAYTPVTYYNESHELQTVQVPTILLASDTSLEVETARVEFKVHFSSVEKQDDGKLRILSSVQDQGRNSMGGHMVFDVQLASRRLPGTEVLVDQTKLILQNRFIDDRKNQVSSPESQLWSQLASLNADITEFFDGNGEWSAFVDNLNTFQNDFVLASGPKEYFKQLAIGMLDEYKNRLYMDFGAVEEEDPSKSYKSVTWPNTYRDDNNTFAVPDSNNVTEIYVPTENLSAQ